MALSLQDKILQTINNNIDGLDLIKLIGYRPDTVQEMGTIIKCFCPMHQERVFRSLLIDNKKKIMRCAFKTCIGFNGGSLIDLYAYTFNISPYNAASEIAKKLHLDVDTNVFSSATSELLQTAKKLYSEGNTEETIKKCLEARDMDASNLDVTRLLIDAYKSLNKNEEMTREYINLSKALQNKNDFNSAVAVLRELLGNNPQNLNALSELASLYEKIDNREEMIKIYKNTISILKERNQFAEVIDIYRKILKKDEGLLDLRLDLAETFEKINDIKSAIKELEKIAKWHKYNGELEKEKSIYQKILSLQKDNETAKISLADVSLRLNDTQGAKNIFKELAEAYFKTNNLEQAGNYFKRVIEIDENDIDSLQKLSTTYASLGEEKRASEIDKKLLDHFYKTEDWSNILQCASKILEKESDNLPVREILGTALIKQGKINEGVDELLKLVGNGRDRSLQKEEKAIRLFKELLQLNPQDVELRRRIIEHYVKIYAGSKLPQLILNELVNLTKIYIELENPKQAQNYADTILQQEPSNIPALELALSISEKQGDTDGVISKAIKLADLYSSQDNTTQVKACLSKVLTYDDKNTSAMERLLELHLKDNEHKQASELLQSLIKEYEKSNQTDLLITSIEKIFLVGNGLKPFPTIPITELKEKLINLYLIKDEKEKALKEIVSLADIQIQEESFTKAEKILLQGKQLSENNEDILKALMHLYDRWDKDNQFIEYANQLANLYLAQNEDQKASTLFDIILSKDPENLITLELQAKIFDKMGKKEESLKILKSLASIYQKKKLLDKSNEILKQLLSQQPDDPELLEDLSEAYLKTGNIPEAIILITKAVPLHITKGQPAKALQLYKKVRKHEPKNLEILRKCAELNTNLGNLGDAEKDYKLLAKEFESANNLEEALETYRMILQFKQDDYEIREKEASLLYDIGETYESMNKYVELVKELDEKGQTADAIKLCKEAIKKDEGRSTLYETLAFLYKKMNDFRKYEQTLRENARIEILNRNYSKAEKVLLSILEIAEDDLETLNQLAVIKIELKQTHSAVQYYKQICDKALQKGDEKLAIESINKATELGPDDIDLMKFTIDLKLRLCRGEVTSPLFDDAKNTALKLAKKFVDSGDLEESQKLIAKLKEHSPDPASIREEIAKLFVESEIPELAYSEYLEIALLKKDSDMESAKESCRKGLEIRPSGIELRRIYINLLKESNETEAVYSELERLGSYLENASLLKDAVEIYKEMISIKFNEPPPHKKLTALYEKLENIDALKDELRALGEIEANNENYADAESTLKRLLELAPDDINAKKRYIEICSKIRPEAELIDDYLELADDYLKANVSNESILIYKKVLEIDRTNIKACEILMSLLLKEHLLPELKNLTLDYARLLINKGDSKRAIEKLKTLCEHIPEDTESLRVLIDAYLKINSRGMAAETLSKIIKLYEEAGDFERAIHSCEEKLDIDPFDKETRNKLISLYIKTKREDEAIEEMMKQADIYIKQKLLDSAETEYKKILDIDPKNITVRNYLIETHLHMGLEEDMIEEYRSLADVYMEKGHINNALKTYKKIIELNPKDIDARIKYTDAYLQVGLEEDLINDYVELAKIFSEMGMTKEAAELYKKVGAISDESKNVGDILKPPETCRGGVTPPLQGQDEVISNYKSILKTNKENAAIRVKLAELYEAKGMLKEALQEYKTASETFFKNAELDDCIKICEKLMEKDPTDIHVRDRLQKAILHRDSLKALDSAIDAQPDPPKTKRKMK